VKPASGTAAAPAALPGSTFAALFAVTLLILLSIGATAV
jgi:hypothetical protein